MTAGLFTITWASLLLIAMVLLRFPLVIAIASVGTAVSYTHLTLPTIYSV